MALTHQQLLRVLAVMGFDNCESLFWRFDDGELKIYATCSDFFAWGCGDLEEITDEQDVEILEAACRDLEFVTGRPYPQWIGELYAARKRPEAPANFMFTGKYALPSDVLALFPNRESDG